MAVSGGIVNFWLGCVSWSSVGGLDSMEPPSVLRNAGYAMCSLLLWRGMASSANSSSVIHNVLFAKFISLW